MNSFITLSVLQIAHTSLFLSILNDIFAGEEENWMKQVTSPSVRHIYVSMYLHWSLFLFYFFPRGEHHPTRIIFRRGRWAALLAWSSIWFFRLWRWPRYKLYGSVVILFWPLVNFFVTLFGSFRVSMFTYRTGQSNFQLIVESNLDLFWFCFALVCDWCKNSGHALNQSDAKRKLIRTWSPALSRAFGSLPVVNSRRLMTI